MSQQKIAHTILSLHPKKAAEVLQQMDEQTVLAVGEAVLRHANDPLSETGELLSATAAAAAAAQKYSASANTNHTENPKESLKENKAAQALRAFARETQKPQEKPSPLHIVRALYSVAFGAERASELVKLLLRAQVNRRLDFVRVYKEDEILAVIKDESPVVISIVLGAVYPRVAGKVLTMLPAETRAAVVRQMARQSTPDINSIEAVEHTVRRRLHEVTAAEPADTPGGLAGLSSIVAKLSADAQNALLEQLDDEDLSQRLREKLFSWDLCFSLPKKDVGELMDEFSIRDLAKMCAVYGPEAQKAFAHGLSEHNQMLLEDEVEIAKMDPRLKSDAAELKAVFSRRLRMALARV